MPFETRPLVRAALAAALIAGVVTSAHAQATPPTPTQNPAPAQNPAPTQTPAPTAESPATAPTGPVRPLSIDEAVQLALKQNLNLQIERLNPQVQDYSIAQALANYTPVFGGGIQYNNQQQPPSSFLSGSNSTVTSNSFGGNAQLAKFFPWGTNGTVSWDSSRATTNSIFSSFNPSLNGNVDVRISQPLLRNFKFDTVRQQVYTARKNREISDVNLQQSVALITRQVKNAYWEYVYSLDSLQVARQSLDLAQESLRNTKSRVEIGTLAPIDIVQAESEVASREEAVILAEASIGQTEDILRTLIFDPNTRDFWAMQLKPTDVAPFLTQAVDVDAAVRNALKDRTDLITTRKQMDITDYDLKYYKNQTLPSLDFTMHYNSTGIGGTQLVREGEGFPPPVVGTVERSYLDLMKDVLSAKYPTWVLALNVSYPIGTSIAEASYSRAKVQKVQSDLNLRDLELNVSAQVRDAARQLTANSKRVDATKAARVLAERRLEAEEKKFAAGMSTSFEVFQAQRDLSQARSNELRAVLDYDKSQVDFETVQVAPIGGTANFAAQQQNTLAGATSSALSGAVSGSVAGTTVTGTTGTTGTATGP
jgi:outer membrane protein TolC